MRTSFSRELDPTGFFKSSSTSQSQECNILNNKIDSLVIKAIYFPAKRNYLNLQTERYILSLGGGGQWKSQHNCLTTKILKKNHFSILEKQPTNQPSSHLTEVEKNQCQKTEKQSQKVLRNIKCDLRILLSTNRSVKSMGKLF